MMTINKKFLLTLSVMGILGITPGTVFTMESTAKSKTIDKFAPEKKAFNAALGELDLTAPSDRAFLDYVKAKANRNWLHHHTAGFTKNVAEAKRLIIAERQQYLDIQNKQALKKAVQSKVNKNSKEEDLSIVNDVFVEPVSNKLEAAPQVINVNDETISQTSNVERSSALTESQKRNIENACAQLKYTAAQTEMVLAKAKGVVNNPDGAKNFFSSERAKKFASKVIKNAHAVTALNLQVSHVSPNQVKVESVEDYSQYIKDSKREIVSDSALMESSIDDAPARPGTPVQVENPEINSPSDLLQLAQNTPVPADDSGLRVSARSKADEEIDISSLFGGNDQQPEAPRKPIMPKQPEAPRQPVSGEDNDNAEKVSLLQNPWMYIGALTAIPLAYAIYNIVDMVKNPVALRNHIIYLDALIDAAQRKDAGLVQAYLAQLQDYLTVISKENMAQMRECAQRGQFQEFISIAAQCRNEIAIVIAPSAKTVSKEAFVKIAQRIHFGFKDEVEAIKLWVAKKAAAAKADKAEMQRA